MMQIPWWQGTDAVIATAEFLGHRFANPRVLAYIELAREVRCSRCGSAFIIAMSDQKFQTFSDHALFHECKFTRQPAA